jgi:hypothetical protein
MCDDFKLYAKRLGYRLLDVRQAVQAGCISGSLSEDAFHTIMTAFVHGEEDRSGKSELQAGARAERFSKRQKTQ